MIFIIAFLIMDFGYTPLQSLFLSTTFLPTVVLLHMLLSNYKLEKKMGAIVGLISMLVGLYFLQLLFVGLANFVLQRLSITGSEVPSILSNPVFILLILGLYYLPFRLLYDRFGGGKQKGASATRTVCFVSSRRHIKLKVVDILYIESCDSEVWLHSTSGEKFVNRTNITSWSKELGSDFVRIHRSFLVNLKHIEHTTPSDVTLHNGTKLSISRSYRTKLEALEFGE